MFVCMSNVCDYLHSYNSLTYIFFCLFLAKLPNSKLNLYVINEIKEEEEQQLQQQQYSAFTARQKDSPILLSGSLMLSNNPDTTTTTLIPLNSSSSHISTMYPQPFMAAPPLMTPSSSSSSSTSHLKTSTMFGSSCNQPQHPSHFFISSPADGILYTTTISTPQILSINEKVCLFLFFNKVLLHYCYKIAFIASFETFIDVIASHNMQEYIKLIGFGLA